MLDSFQVTTTISVPFDGEDEEDTDEEGRIYEEVAAMIESYDDEGEASESISNAKNILDSIIEDAAGFLDKMDMDTEDMTQNSPLGQYFSIMFKLH